ncbi:ScbA/BarX family gamma-butyrolactone biosynthesis protein [Streptomyces sp. BE147]|uniref:ScbA/BarX family gamma-butyrolactone biosynthesis protein n=1 Tax=Streptomyces sp. BE147 TaxID=3002524 RepID=UPI002E77667B|nr:ScbA/BarX family gamma-butyrolactone biosynthesis protein [Streptomyces sp. BE147]MEE1736235.1 ScbA/BarX family gamma-butyrolactone biosynthesis protein [Streptomyces sp. BE147]
MTSFSGHGSTTLHPQRSTVANLLVRKTDPTEVLVTEWYEISDTQHVVTTEWPCSHPFYTPEQEIHSPLLFTESTRQALALLSHTEFGIPLDHRLGWEYISCSTTPEGLRTTGSPAEVKLHITHTSVNRRRLGCARLTAEIEATRDGVRMGSAQIRYTAYPENVYRRLRGRYASAAESCARALPPGRPVNPALAGRKSDSDVVLSPTTHDNLWFLRADLTHSVLFDHPHDHIPGMVLLEAFSQAAGMVCAPQAVRPLSFDAVFKRYVELDQPCLIEAEALTRSSVKLVATQGDTVTASAMVTTAPA